MSIYEEQFNNNFNKYKEITDKYESLYIFVIFEITREEMEENFIRFFKMLDGISDQKKKGFLKSRISDFKKNIDSTKDTIINGIYLVGESIKYYSIEKYHVETLKMFKVNKYNYKFGKNYDILWLKNLLLDRTYVNVIKVKNNDIAISKINSTKQLCTFNETIKSMNLLDILKTKVEKEKEIKIMIHGNSSNLKQLVDYKNKLCLGIINKELSLEEINDFIEDSLYLENINELQKHLERLDDPKLVFGNDVLEQGESGFIKIIYCTPENLEKYYGIDNLEIKIIKSSKKNETINNFIKNFDSVLGIKYY